MKVTRSCNQPEKPEMPFFADFTYWITFMLSIYFKDEKILHGIFSTLPLFMILNLTLNRLVRGESGSSVMMLSLLAELIVHLLNQFLYFVYDERFTNMDIYGRLICSIFIVLGNLFYVLLQRKREIFDIRKEYLKQKLRIPQSTKIIPITILGFCLVLYEITNDNTNQILYSMKVLNSALLTIQLIYAIKRSQTTSKKSYYFGLAASIIFILQDLSYQSFPLIQKMFHTFSLYFRTRQMFYHIKWFQKNKKRFE
ncbi:unnamed protein product [Paramecium octaurelia]|uniref:Uncharacterized protein n=1 Tax=Paramecium octaurelia TaxID=43137 RepID=A0A8S1SAM7_PAROT|nr:unnamed protein product [Paramecium octaurelia]